MPQLSAKILRRQTATGLPVDDELSTPAGIDPYQYAVPEEFDVSSEMSNVVDPMELAAQSKEALGSLQQPREKIDVKQAPDIPMSPAASNKRTFEDISLRPEQELGEQQLLRNYLLSLQKRRDSEGELRDLNAQALDRGRVAMLAEGLSESASKMGNILGTPTGSTMQGFGKEAANLEMTGVDQARKIMQESDPTMELARQAQIAQMMENIRASRAKTGLTADTAAAKAASDAEKNKILGARVRGGTSLKPLPSEMLQAASSVGSALSGVSRLVDLIKQNQEWMGPVQGTAKSLNPYDSDAKNFLSAANLYSQQIGKFIEQGKMTDQDREFYVRNTPKPSDTPEVAIKKAKNLEQMIRDKAQSFNQTATAGGYKIPITPDMMPAIDYGEGAPTQQPKGAAPQKAGDGANKRQMLLNQYKNKGYVVLKDTTNGEYFAVKKEDVPAYMKMKNPKHGNESRYTEAKE